MTETVLEVCPNGLHCEWGRADDTQPTGSLVQLLEGPAFWVLHKQRAFVPMQQRLPPTSDGHIAATDPGRTLVGPWGRLRLKEFHCDGGGAGDISMHLHGWLLEDQPAMPLPLGNWWPAILPHFGEAVRGLGLPARIALFLGPAPEPSVVMALTDLQPQHFAPARFVPPPGYNLGQPQEIVVQPKADAQSQMRTRLQEDRPSTQSARTRSAAPPVVFSIPLLKEDAKLVFNGRLISKAVQAINAAWSYLDGFQGTNFVFNTSSWIEQLKRNAPVPVIPAEGRPPPVPNKSVAPGLIARTGFFLLFQAVDQLRKDPQQLALLQRALAHFITRLIHPWAGFLLVLSASEVDKLGAMLNEQDYTDITFAGDLVEDIRDLSRASGRQPEVGSLGRKWLTFLTPDVDVTPNIPLTQRDGRTKGFRPDKSLVLEGVADLIDVTVSDWQNTLDLSRQSLLDEPQFVDGANFAALFPGTAAPGDFDIGLFTRIRLHEIRVHCSISTVPTTRSVLVAGLILFCPPCFAALWEQGSATIFLPGVQMPVLIYPSQGQLGSGAAGFKALVGQIQSDDPDVTLIIGPTFLPLPQLAVAFSLIGSFLGGTFLDGFIGGLSTKVQDAVDKLLAKLPPVDLNEIVLLEKHYVGDLGPPVYQGSRLDQGYELAVSASVPPPTSGGRLVHPTDADITLLLSNGNFSLLLGPLGLRWESELRHPAEGLPTDGQLVDWWNDPPARAGIVQPPANMFSQQPPPPMRVMDPGVQLPSFWAFWSRIRFTTDAFPRVLDVNDPAPGDPMAVNRVHIVIDVGAAFYVPRIYEWCSPTDRGRIPDGGGLPAGPGEPPGPPGPIGPLGPDAIRPGDLVATIHPELLNDPAMLQPPGTLPAGWDPATFRASCVLLPPPDAEGLPQRPGGDFMICQWMVTYDAQQSETWLRVEADFTYYHTAGMRDQFTPSNFHFLLPKLGARILHDFTGADVNITTFDTAHYLSWLNSLENHDQNEQFIKDLIARIIKASVKRQGAVEDLSFSYGQGRLSTPERSVIRLPEVLDPEVYLSLALDRNEPPQDPAHLAVSRPRTIGYESFGADLNHLNVAFKFNLSENVLDRI